MAIEFITRLRFDDAAVDLAGNVWTNNGVTFDEPGKFGGRAAYFPGSSGKRLSLVNTMFNFNATDDFTIAFWYKAMKASGVILGTSKGKLSIDYWSNGAGWELFTGAVVISGMEEDYFADKWNHFALTRCSGVYMMFLNGKMVSSVAKEKALTFGGTTYIGEYYSSGYSYKGYLDDFCVIHNKAVWITDFKLPNGYLTIPNDLYKDSKGTVYGMKEEV